MQYKIFFCLLLLLASCAPTKREPPVSVVQKKEFITYVEGQHRVYFKFNSAEIEDEGVKRVNEMINELSIVRNVTVILYGYTDRSEAGNKKLAESRVHAIKEALVASGAISSNRIKIKIFAFGEYDPLVSFDTIDDNPSSRRVDMFIESKKR